MGGSRAPMRAGPGTMLRLLRTRRHAAAGCAIHSSFGMSSQISAVARGSASRASHHAFNDPGIPGCDLANRLYGELLVAGEIVAARLPMDAVEVGRLDPKDIGPKDIDQVNRQPAFP